MNRLVRSLFLPLAGLAFAIGAASAQLPDREIPSGCAEDAFASAEKLRHFRQPESLTRALDLYQQALACDPSGPSTQRKAEILLNMGRVNLLQENNESAVVNLSSAVDTFQRVDKLTPDIQGEAASALFNRAIALSRLQRVEEALPVYFQALDLFQKLNDKPHQARTLVELGLRTTLMGRNQEALTYYHLALELQQAVGTGDQEDQQQKATLLDMIGRLHAQMNDSELAKSYFRSAVALAKRSHNHLFHAYALNDLGALALTQNHHEVAARDHRAALALLEQYEPSDIEGIAESKELLAEALTASGHYDAAIENFKAALIIQTQVHDAIGEAQSRLSLGVAELATNHLDEAGLQTGRSAELFGQSHERKGESSARFQNARVCALQGNISKARDQVEAAIRLAEEVRTFTPGHRLRTTYFASLEVMYRFAIDLLMKGNPPPLADQILAFELFQHAQSRAILDALESRTAEERFLGTDELLARRNHILLQLKEQNLKLETLIGEEASGSAVEKNLLEIERLETALDQVRAESHSEQTLPPSATESAISIPQIQQEIVDQNNVFIQFYLSNSSGYAWVITRSQFRLVRIPSEKALQPQLRRVLRFGPSGEWTRFQQVALDNIDNYLDPVFRVAGNATWIVVPDGSLHHFPFALLALEKRRVIEIVKAPSASAIALARKAAGSLDGPAKLALIADPVFDLDDSRVKNLNHLSAPGIPDPSGTRQESRQRRGKTVSYPRLLNSRREANLISLLLPRSQQLSLLDFDARLDAISGKALASFQFIHFATHSVVDNEHPDLSRIVLSLVDRGGRPQPGYLFVKDIYRLQLHSDLVVLSSCRSAVGSSAPGEGPMSISRAFLYAGAKSVLAGLWEADDAATAEFMGQFYLHIFKEGLSPLAALATTQMEFRRHRIPALRNPYYWAGFELYGEWTGARP